MRNVSTSGEDVVLSSNNYYYVIDVLYLTEIGARTDTLNTPTLDKELREIFPHTKTPFAKVKVANSFDVRRIKKAKAQDVNGSKEDYFSCDTGIIMLVMDAVFLNVVNKFDYNKLVETQTAEFNVEYWDNIAADFNLADLALILAPGINSGYEFEGSGLYRIESL